MKDMMNYFILFFVLLTSLFSCSQPDHSAEIKMLKQQLSEAEAKAADIQCPEPTFIHSVFFWAKEGITDEEMMQFKKAVQSLSAIESIQTFYMGPPANTAERGVVDNSYDIALICQFAKAEDQDAYQIDPIHLKFVEENKDMWTKVVVYDNLVE